MQANRALGMVFAALSGAASATDLDASHLARIGHADLLERRLDEVVEIYGPPHRLGSIVDGTPVHAADGSAPDAGADWTLSYRFPRPKTQRNGHYVSGMSPADFSALVIMAAGEKGLVVKDAQGHLRHEVPADPYRAHEVYAVAGRLQQPLQVDEVLSAFAPAKGEVVRSQGRDWIRIWALRAEGEMPLRMYALDFGLSDSGKRVTDVVVTGVGAAFVRAELHARHRLWERNLSD